MTNRLQGEGGAGGAGGGDFGMCGSLSGVDLLDFDL